MTAHTYDVVVREAALVNRIAHALGFVRENEAVRLQERVDELTLAVARLNMTLAVISHAKG